MTVEPQWQNATHYPSYDDPYLLGLSIFGVLATLPVIFQFIRVYIYGLYICFPENTWCVHSTLLVSVCCMFILSSTVMFWLFFNHSAVTLLIQLTPTIAVSCLFVLSINLFLICNYALHLSSHFLFLTTLLVIIPVPILFSPLIQKFNYVQQIETVFYQTRHEITQAIITNSYLYLDYLLTIAMFLTLCLYKTHYGKILCIATWMSWVLWNIHWCVMDRAITAYLALSFGYILLIFYIYPIVLSAYYTKILRFCTNRSRRLPPPLLKRFNKNFNYMCFI
ncbi:G protein-coupled receptor 7 [Elephant endotheliotropic herpesvirus 1A]|uniref:G protein-coupled receptor 7 n=1 Tax=Elephant endotheliotropic herpesvirus 1A TaxID=759753 RepID=M1RMG2_ELHV1|nr:G protein-coupled receptor 7 [Elephant endotheliotropic herpesvirus 1A]AYF58620.1 G protein-coupled receptor 7 [Elephant endotheliotropic herpesvirus 1A]